MNFQGGPPFSSCLGFLAEDDEFKFVKGRKSKSSAASEFNINTTNKIEALMKKAEIEIEENECIEEDIKENITHRVITDKKVRNRKPPKQETKVNKDVMKSTQDLSGFFCSKPRSSL